MTTIPIHAIKPYRWLSAQRGPAHLVDLRTFRAICRRSTSEYWRPTFPGQHECSECYILVAPLLDLVYRP